MPAARVSKRKAAEITQPEESNKKGLPRKGLLPRSVASKTESEETKKVAAAPAAGKTKAAKRVKKVKKEVSPAVEDVPVAPAPPPTKATKARKATPPARKVTKELPKLTELSTEILKIFTFGSGESGELGQGPTAKEIKRPRLNSYLLPEKAGIVQVALGGMHGLALTREGKVWSWGVNDLCALGRETKVEEQTRDVGDSDNEDDEVSLNKLESVPMPIKSLPEDVVITKIAAGDSISIAVTDTGKVYGWGTFRAADGVLGFSDVSNIQEEPVLISGLKDIIDACCGNDHVLVLDKNGIVYAWGNGQQNQLGRRVVERTRKNGLTPRAVGFPHRKKIAKIFSGQYHSFAIDRDGLVWAWGLNGFAETGIYEEDAGEGLLTIPTPQLVESLSSYDVDFIAAGQHHSLAITATGDLMTWGRMDAMQTGVLGDKCPEEDVIKDVAGKDRLLINPTKVSNARFITADCGIDHTVAIDSDGQAWSWGYGGTYAVGQGPSGVDIEVPAKIENTATRGFNMKVVNCGGHFSSLAGVPPSDADDASN